MPAHPPTGFIPSEDGRGKYELPGQFMAGARPLVQQRIRHWSVPAAPAHILSPARFHGIDLCQQTMAQRCRQHDDSVLIPFGGADDNLRPAKVDIPDAQSAHFADAHASAVH